MPTDISKQLDQLALSSTPEALNELVSKAQTCGDRQQGINYAKQVVEKCSKRIQAGNAVETKELSLEEAMRLYEQSLIVLACLYMSGKNCEELIALCMNSLQCFQNMPKTKTAKCMRQLIDSLCCHIRMPLTFPASVITQTQAKESLDKVSAVEAKMNAALVHICKTFQKWCQEQTRTFLLYRINLKLVHILIYNQRDIQQAQEIIQDMMQSVKKLDDKLLLIELFLYESVCLYIVNNIPKARASLTAARTNANAVHCPPNLQGLIDIHAGVLHANEKDYKTAFSYFFEAFEALSALESAQQAHQKHKTSTVPQISLEQNAPESRALLALKYMLLTKILMGKTKDVHTILTGSQGLKYYQQESYSQQANSYPAVSRKTTTERDAQEIREIESQVRQNVCPDLEMLRLLSISNTESSVYKYEYVLEKYRPLIVEDYVLSHHIEALYNLLLEENIKKLLMPYERIEVSHLSDLIRIPQQQLISKLSEMILDGHIHATLDQGIDTLVLFDHSPTPSFYGNSLKIIQNLEKAVETLHQKAQQAVF